MPVTVKGTNGGGVTLDAGAAAADTTLTLPNTSGTILQSGTAVTAAQGGTGLTSPGANGNVLTSNGTTWTSAAPAATASLTLLATVATTSGTTVSVTGLATTYTNLLIILDNVGNSTGASSFQIAASSNNGSSYGSTASQSVGISANICFEMTIYRANASVTPRAIRTGNSFSALATPTAAPINALQFSWAGGYAFNAGTIYIYGSN